LRTVLRTGIQWQAVLRERFGPPSTGYYEFRRWVVGVCHAWLNRFRTILVRVEKLEASHLGLLQFARASIVLKRAGNIRGYLDRLSWDLTRLVAGSASGSCAAGAVAG
jgi:hypothetical protein